MAKRNSVAKIAAKVSDNRDGFSMKKRSTVRKKKTTFKDPCTIPPPLAKHILSSYTLSTPNSQKGIREYVELQTRDEEVQHLEKVKSEHVIGHDVDCWDVHTQRDRYWVITSPTNLYSQEFFPSLDYTLSFHIGVTARIMAMQRGAPDETQRLRLTAVWRRWEEAASSYDTGEEAEDFQAVGMKCREALIQLVRSVSKPEMVPAGAEQPQRSNVVSWSEHIANAVAPGPNNADIRGHLKVLAKSAWQLANWLTHANNAKRTDAAMVLDATHNAISTYASAVIRYESGSPERCPTCGSYAIEVGFNPELMPRPYVSECDKCGWQSQEQR